MLLLESRDERRKRETRARAFSGGCETLIIFNLIWWSIWAKSIFKCCSLLVEEQPDLSAYSEIYSSKNMFDEVARPKELSCALIKHRRSGVNQNWLLICHWQPQLRSLFIVRKAWINVPSDRLPLHIQFTHSPIYPANFLPLHSSVSRGNIEPDIQLSSPPAHACPPPCPWHAASSPREWWRVWRQLVWEHLQTCSFV